LTLAGYNDMDFNVFSKKEMVMPKREAKNQRPKTKLFLTYPISIYLFLTRESILII
jgi:hypothetical protein